MHTSNANSEQCSVNGQTYRHFVMIVAGLLFVGSGIVSLVQQDWRKLSIAAILIVLIFAPFLAERWVDLKVPGNIQFQYGLLLLMGPYLGGYWLWYEIWQPWDTVVHFYSGIFVSFALILALGKTLHVYQLKLPVWFEMVMLITTKALIALVWEIGEFIFDLTFDTRTQGGNFDTMTDMIAGLIPALVIAGVLYAYRRRGIFKYIGSLLDAGRCTL